MLKTLVHRVYGDFLMPSRLPEYQELLGRALSRGYQCRSVIEFFRQLPDGLSPGDRIIVLRHDVDTDPATAARLFSINRGLGVQASYYFRLSTLDIPLMRRIHEAGSEASYHFEEIATVAKRRRLRTRSAAVAHLPEARERFLENLAGLRERTGLPMHTVASHGDFVNRHLGLPNQALLDDRVRKAADLAAEVYDVRLQERYSCVISDAPYPTFWKPCSLGAAIDREAPVIQVLMHPRHWQPNIPVNLHDDLRRAWQGMAYRLPG